MNSYTCEMTVIAGGPAGLAAAITAAEKGVKVIVVEKAGTTGGASNMGMGPFAVESSVQRTGLIGLSRDEAFRKFMDYTHWRSDARLVRNYINKSADTIDWLKKMGVEFQGAYKYFPQSEATWHIVRSATGMGPRAASAMIKAMTSRAWELGVHILLNTRAVRICLGDDRSVCGVDIQDASGEAGHIECDSAVIATGGFGDNPEMIKSEIGYDWGKDLFSFRIPGLVGDGIRMAREVGAASTEPNMELTYTCPTATNYKCLASMHRQPNLFVNLLGERFINEEICSNTTFTANAIALQKGRCGIGVIDDSIVKEYMQTGAPYVSLVSPSVEAADYYDDVQKALSENDPYFVVADSIPELAQKLGVDAKALSATVDEYNAGCATNDKLFGKRQDYMRPLVGPKFYAMRFFPCGYGTLGGIRTNYKLEVIRDDFEPIAGLYGAGTDVCNIFGDSYVFILPGNTMGFALNSGRMAAENAAEYLNSIYS